MLYRPYPIEKVIELENCWFFARAKRRSVDIVKDSCRIINNQYKHRGNDETRDVHKCDHFILLQLHRSDTGCLAL